MINIVKYLLGICLFIPLMAIAQTECGAGVISVSMGTLLNPLQRDQGMGTIIQRGSASYTVVAPRTIGATGATRTGGGDLGFERIVVSPQIEAIVNTLTTINNGTINLEVLNANGSLFCIKTLGYSLAPVRFVEDPRRLAGNCNGETATTGFRTERRVECVDPIILDLGAPGLHLTGLDDTVAFDIDGDGVIDDVSWTAAGAEDAFLVLDRNRNGVVDDGMELFGDAVTLEDGSVSMQGFQALWELDLPSFGGDDSGVLDRKDRAFRQLRLWRDANHNGYSEPWELKSLRAAGIIALSLNAEMIMVADENGNKLIFASRAYGIERGRFKEIPAYDVLLQIKE